MVLGVLKNLLFMMTFAEPLKSKAANIQHKFVSPGMSFFPQMAPNTRNSQNDTNGEKYSCGQDPLQWSCDREKNTLLLCLTRFGLTGKPDHSKISLEVRSKTYRTGFTNYCIGVLSDVSWLTWGNCFIGRSCWYVAFHICWIHRRNYFRVKTNK